MGFSGKNTAFSTAWEPVGCLFSSFHGLEAVPGPGMGYFYFRAIRLGVRTKPPAGLILGSAVSAPWGGDRVLLKIHSKSGLNHREPRKLRVSASKDHPFLPLFPGSWRLNDQGRSPLQKLKISGLDHSGIAIISGEKGFHPGIAPALREKSDGLSAETACTGKPRWSERVKAEAPARPGEWWMNQLWKKFFFLDFEKSFFLSGAKLLFVWNPVWTFLVTLILGNRTLASILFRWAWNFLEATLVCFLGLSVIRLVVLAERIMMLRSSRNPASHGTGWYLLFLAFLAPAGLYAALHLMVAGINFFYAGDPIAASFQWEYYGTETFWVWALLLLSFLFKYWQDLRDAAQQGQIRAEELEKERLQAALAKLKDQMNPHFLFNTLNTVAALIPADPAKAEEVVVKLSTMFQAVLEATRRTNHPLEKELEFCRDYLDIEKARFGPRLTAFFEVEKGLDPAKVFVPVLLLQPLVENAVKHGLSSRAAGGKVWVKGSLRGGRLELGVEDDGVGFGNSSYAGSGTALGNCRKRLELEFGKEGKLEILPREGGGTRIGLSMPMLTAENEKG